MPFTITTKRPHVGKRNPGLIVVARRAVGTTYEARKAFLEALPDETIMGHALALMDQITEDGGSVGPLPDGTVIDVEPVLWESLAHSTGLDAHAEIIKAYNEMIGVAHAL